jgi:tripartite-type tricarboxylate transporter receptor subunit TctC
VWQHVEAGRLRALAISTVTRSPLHPDLPTFAEAAQIPGFNIVEWYALIAPPSMPRDIAERLQKALVFVIDAKDFRDRCSKVGIEAKSTTMEGLRQSIGDDIKRLSDIASRAEMKLE